MTGNRSHEPDTATNFSAASAAVVVAAAAAAAFDTPLLSSSALPFAELCARIHGRITAFLAQDAADQRLKDVQEQTRTSLAVIYDALDRYRLSELSLSYNGGKDCLVLLILYLSALHAKGLTSEASTPSTNKPGSSPVQCVYIQSQFPFPEVEAFVEFSVVTFGLSLVTYAKSMKAAFADYLHDNGAVRAIFVGTRRTDPHGEHLTHFDPTDHGWPKFMRIHPVIDWHYAEIWTFIRHLRIPYCSLYDQGYTSLGGITDTHPNPALLRPKNSGSEPNGEVEHTFRPAYDLVEDNEERLGRDK